MRVITRDRCHLGLPSNRSSSEGKSFEKLVNGITQKESREFQINTIGAATGRLSSSTGAGQYFFHLFQFGL